MNRLGQPACLLDLLTSDELAPERRAPQRPEELAHVVLRGALKASRPVVIINGDGLHDQQGRPPYLFKC
jgi:hypothetical protein